MTKSVEIEVPRRPDARDLAAFLEGRGLDVQPLPHSRIGVDVAADAFDVRRALAAWLDRRRSLLVPSSPSARGFVLRPPAG